MDNKYKKYMMTARRIASKFETPEFYRKFQVPMALSKNIFYGDKFFKYLMKKVQNRLFDDFGHGLYHVTRVCIDVGIIIYLEKEQDQLDEKEMTHLILLGQIAGLLHDICRGEKDHAKKGAEEALRILSGSGLSHEELHMISEAISNHEAFKENVKCSSIKGQLLSDALYDADKFRWGADNFTHTIWFMLNFANIPLDEFLNKFLWGINGILKIKETFRTPTGRQFGPEIIENGVVIGKEVYQYMVKENMPS